MNNSSTHNNNATIQISTENLEKLRLVLEQLNIKIEDQISQPDNAELYNSQSIENEVNEEEDELEPLVVEDLNDSADELSDENLNTSNINDISIPIVNEQPYETTSNDTNEITSDDIINDVEDDSELDLASDNDDFLMETISQSQQTKLKKSSPLLDSNHPNSSSIPMRFSPITFDHFDRTTETSNFKPSYQKEILNINPNKNYSFVDNFYEDLNPLKCIATNLNKNSFTKKSQIDDRVSSKTENKITLNVGGKKFSLKKNLLECLGINYVKLHKILKEDERTIYFLDRDPYYFSKIIGLIKLYGLDQDKIIEHLEDYSEQLISELCYYGLIDKKFNPRPKLKLKRSVTFSSRHGDIIKLIVDDQQFEISSSILSKSNYFDIKLKNGRSTKFYLSNIDPKLFRYVLNFLRVGELYVVNSEIINLLNNYGVEFEKIENKKVKETIVSHYIPHSIESVHNQILGCLNTIDPRLNVIPKTNIMLQFNDNKYYYPDNMFVSPNVENFNLITTTSQLSFDTDIIFNLTDVTKNYGECIEDLLLCIDIPVLKPTEPYEYAEMLEYLMVEHVQIIMNNDTNSKVLLETSGDLLYLYPIIYTNNSSEYHSMTKISDKKIKLLYDNDLIDIHRITIPLFLFKDKQNILPIRKLIANNISVKLVVKIAPLKKIFKSKIKNIPLLNVCLISNFVNLAPGMNTIKRSENNQSIISIAQINTELLYSPILYIYNKIHFLSVAIENTSNAVYDTVILSLDNFNLIKDFFFTIHDKDDYIAGKMNKFSDNLIELEILQVKENPQTKQKMIFQHTKLDSSMLNYYIPIKRLGHTLPTGIYYHSFSSDPRSSQILGGLMGTGYLLRLKIKKMDGFVKFYVGEYLKEIF
jgi:hypothetical protein